MNVRFYKAAQKEFDSAVEYYETQLSGLGFRYRQEVLDCLARIKLFPDSYSPISKRTRRCLISKFPYGIIYQGTRMKLWLSQWRIDIRGLITGYLG